ncbi:hypothetical protein V2J09_022652 [Rumex salicifolius]
MSDTFTVESSTVEVSNGVSLRTRVFRPTGEIQDTTLAILLVHPYSVLGGCQGLLRGMAAGLAGRGYVAVTFDMRGVGRSTGRASLTGFAEVKDVTSVSNWISQTLSLPRIFLVGSSAGAPIAGSAVDQIEQVIGYVSIGYPFGLTASILFGRHHKAILQSPKPKLFIMGTRDGFTSVKQLKSKLNSASGRVETHLIEGASHFQMEGPAFDAQMHWSIYNMSNGPDLDYLSSHMTFDSFRNVATEGKTQPRKLLVSNPVPSDLPTSSGGDLKAENSMKTSLRETPYTGSNPSHNNIPGHIFCPLSHQIHKKFCHLAV